MSTNYSQLVKRAANLAIAVAALLIVIKAIAWWKTGSISILAAMTDSVVDLFASITNVIVLRFALQPADEIMLLGMEKPNLLQLSRRAHLLPVLQHSCYCKGFISLQLLI